MEHNEAGKHGKIYHCLEYSYENTGEMFFIACGHEKCSPHIINGPDVREAYHLHVILSGKGTLLAGGQEFHPHFGQMFLLKDKEEVKYYSDENDPWEYCWIVFNGSKAKDMIRDMGFTDGVYVVDSSIGGREFFDIIYRMHQKPELTYYNEIRMTGLMYEFLGLALEATSTEELIKSRRNEKSIESYIHMAEEFIHYNYNSITVNEICEYVGFTRSYFSTVFKARTGLSPQKYLMQYRLKKACEQLKTTENSIQEIADSVGYDNALTFSRTFKNAYGISPSTYRLNSNRIKE